MGYNPRKQFEKRGIADAILSNVQKSKMVQEAQELLEAESFSESEMGLTISSNGTHSKIEVTVSNEFKDLDALDMELVLNEVLTKLFARIGEFSSETIRKHCNQTWNQS